MKIGIIGIGFAGQLHSKVIEMPVYHFHDAFLKYTNILNEKYPKKLRKIKIKHHKIVFTILILIFLILNLQHLPRL